MERDFNTVNDEILHDKFARKAFRTIAYAMGTGVGFLILLPFLPDIGDEVKAAAMKHIFYRIAIFLMGYSIVMMFVFIFFRDAMKFILFVMNWIVIPSAAVWCIVEGYRVISGS